MNKHTLGIFGMITLWANAFAFLMSFEHYVPAFFVMITGIFVFAFWSIANVSESREAHAKP